MKQKNYALIEGWLSVAGNIILFGLKYWVGLVTGSIALIADAWHTLTDSISSVVVIVSARLSKKPADAEHPFGHGRADLISAVIIGLLLTFIGFEFITKSVEQLKGGEQVVFGKLAWIITILSILTKEALAQYAFWAARRSNSITLKADGWHHRTDALSSLIVLIGIGLGRFFWWMDGVLGIVVALMIFWAAYEILQSSTKRLMGETPDKEIMENIQSIVKELKVDMKPHHFHMHRYGDHIELTFHIYLPDDWSLNKAHAEALKVEEALRSRHQIEATIHMEPSSRMHLS